MLKTVFLEIIAKMKELNVSDFYIILTYKSTENKIIRVCFILILSLVLFQNSVFVKERKH